MAIPGALRLVFELCLFGFAAWGLNVAGQSLLALVLAIITVAHYALSYDRVIWLLQQTGTRGPGSEV